MTQKEQQLYSALSKSEKIKWLDFDLNNLQEQRTILVDAIENGNWKGMSDNLKVRKSNLKELDRKISNIINSKNSLMLS